MPRRVAPDDSLQVVSLVRRMALQTSLAAATSILQQGILGLTGSIRARVLTHDPKTGVPWMMARPNTPVTPSLAAAAARAGYGVRLARPGQGAPYDAKVDDPDGRGDERLLAQPIRVDGNVLAVIVAVRPGHAPEYGEREQGIVGLLAEQSAAFLWQLALGEARPQEEAGPQNPLFRKQALERHRASRREGPLADLSPVWVARTYWIAIAAVVIALVYGIVANVNQYSTGPAVIKMEGADVTARDPGTVESVKVAPGQRVVQGELLVQLHSEAERAALEETEVEYRQQLGTFLIEPSDATVRASLATVVARRQKAAKVLEMRAVRAPSAGIVSDVRVHSGSHLKPGDQIVTLLPEDGMPIVVALLPGGDRPRLKEGMTLQLEIPGFQKVRENAEILTIGEEVIGPQEAARYLGEKVAGSVQIKGAVVLVRARLPGRTFTAKDTVYQYHDGMTAQAEVVVRERSAIVALVPALEKLR